MDDNQAKLLQAFTRFRELKKKVREEHQESTPELEEAREEFCRLVPHDDKEKVLKDWEQAFYEAECMHHHQGG